MPGDALPPSIGDRRSALRRLGAPSRQRDLHRRLEMEVALWIGELDAVGLELVPDQQQHVALDVADAVLGIADPDAQLELDRAGGKAEQDADRRGLREDARRLRRRLQTEGTGLPYI